MSQDRRVALGHARLSIIDLTTGAQPIASENDQARIIVNGEFYDFEAIRAELERSGHHFRTGSDSEIALHLYQDLGPQALHRLRGEFSFVLWDATSDTLFAEGRVPFLDHKVVEVVRSQPVNLKMRGTTEKYVLREAARDVITDTIYRRQKHPFLSPPSTLNPRGKHYALVQDTLRGRSLAAIPFLDQQKLITFLDPLGSLDESARVASDLVLMSLTSTCILQERFKLAA
jgi:asparagine synthetase B (glutamine-hydrolysing)